MATVAIEQEVLELERQYWRAIQNRDAEAAMRLTDESCIVTGAQGVRHIDRQGLASMMAAAPYTLEHFDVKDAEVRLLNDDVAIVAYKVHEQLTVDGKSVSLDAADSSTWVRRNNRWVCALHTEAIVGDPFGRDRRAASR